jgi:MFS family permease
LMVSAAFTFLVQVTVMQRLQLRPTQFIRVGLLFMLFGAAVVSGFETFTALAVGMAFLGTGMALCMPSISAGASLAVSPEEQGAAAGLVSSCPAIGFAVGPICAGALYQIHSPLAPLFSAAVFFTALIVLVINDR